MEDFVERAKRLQADRLDQERQDRERATLQAQRQEEQRQADAQLTRDLLDQFKRFDGFKIANGAASLAADLTHDAKGNALLCLKVQSAGLSVLHMLNAPVVAARAMGGTYELRTYSSNRPAGLDSTKKFTSVEKMMAAVADAVGKW